MFGPVTISSRRPSSSCRSFAYEGRFQQLLDDRVASGADAQSRRIAEFRSAPVERLRAFRQRHQHVGLGDCGRHAAQCRQHRHQRVEQARVEFLLARQRAVARRQHLALEFLQLRRDVALGTLERLAALVIVGRLVRLATAQLDVVTVHAVVADLQRGQSGACAFAAFEIREIAVGVFADVAQLVEALIVARRDHATVADQHGRVVDQRAAQQAMGFRMIAEPVGQGAQQRRSQRGELRFQRRQQRTGVAQLGQIARPG